MQAPDCLICGKFFPDNQKVMFSNYKKPEFTDPPGGPPGVAYFCQEHLAAGQSFSHMTSQQAITELTATIKK